MHSNAEGIEKSLRADETEVLDELLDELAGELNTTPRIISPVKYYVDDEDYADFCERVSVKPDGTMQTDKAWLERHPIQLTRHQWARARERLPLCEARYLHTGFVKQPESPRMTAIRKRRSRYKDICHEHQDRPNKKKKIESCSPINYLKRTTTFSSENDALTCENSFFSHKSIAQKEFFI